MIKSYETMLQDDWKIHRVYEPYDESCPLSLQDFFFRALDDEPATRPSARQAAAELEKIIESCVQWHE